ncbi:hypothetical protein SAMN05421810_1053 [Amycolatopsis arida]|uniref:Uncharacterized protein n=1 Tax=Amycolatopsis arida TaxID=587909 RepID=A0A1I5W969_9PSEU|nr:hypothetical protein [Amycolatopsis arida]TDX92178.1 hypothetical protein CLV69_10522 [Amycolatopsis arida]SFQ16328.1 hypothetical protein SAMN05421810_1053 [Amycolatopsis arida]
MPIRTNRGRAAVYRRLWGWPLRSPAHLAGALVLFVALVVGLGIVLPKIFGDGGAGRTPPGAASSAERTGDTRGSAVAGRTPLPTRLTEPRETPTPAAPDPDAMRVARQWAEAWVHHPEGMTTEQWLDNLRPLTTPEYLPVMSTVELSNIPAGKVTGEPVATMSYTSSVEVEVPTDGPTLSITVVRTDAGWRVAHYEQAG